MDKYQNNKSVKGKDSEKNKTTNGNISNLSKEDKKSIAIYTSIALLAIIFIILIIFLFISNIKGRRKEEKVKFETRKLDPNRPEDINAYINKRDIKESELHETDYMMNARFQMERPKEGDYILELKFEGYNPMKFKIFLPSAPRLGLDLEKAVKEGKLKGKKINNWTTSERIHVNHENNEKIWSIHSKRNLDLKLLPFYGALTVDTENKYGDENYGGAFNIIVSKKDNSEELEKRRYPRQVVELAKEYKGTIFEDYSKNSVIGQIFEGEDVLEKISNDLENRRKAIEEGEILETDVKDIIIENAEFYMYGEK